MWRLFNKLFGWHYIAFKFDSSFIVRKIKYLGTIPYVKAYGHQWFIIKNGNLKRVEGGVQSYIPLTFTGNDYETLRIPTGE